LVSLRGLGYTDEDIELLQTIQNVLWPFNLDTIHEHRSFLNDPELLTKLDMIEADMGPRVASRFRGCRVDMLKSLDDSEAYAQSTAGTLQSDFREAALNPKMAQRVAAKAELDACRWLGQNAPTKPMSQVEGVNTVYDAMGVMNQNMQLMTKFLEQQTAANGESEQVRKLKKKLKKMKKQAAKFEAATGAQAGTVEVVAPETTASEPVVPVVDALPGEAVSEIVQPDGGVQAEPEAPLGKKRNGKTAH
jgi:hypothetical protein